MDRRPDAAKRRLEIQSSHRSEWQSGLRSPPETPPHLLQVSGQLDRNSRLFVPSSLRSRRHSIPPRLRILHLQVREHHVAETLPPQSSQSRRRPRRPLDRRFCLLLVTLQIRQRQVPPDVKHPPGIPHLIGSTGTGPYHRLPHVPCVHTTRWILASDERD